MNDSDLGNATVLSDNGTAAAPENPRVPPWVMSTYFAILACGSLVNLVHVLALTRCRRNGTLSLILQISLVDIVSVYVSLSEIITLDHRTWIFPADLCPLFKGSEILVNSLTVYLLICFNFHVISLWNLHEWEVKKSRRNPLTSCGNSKDDSNECLVTKQENPNRIVNIDYRRRKNDISVVFPTIFLWFVSLSLSVPNFTLSSTLKINDNYTLCAVIDVYYGQVLQHLLLAFKIVIPVALLSLTLVILLAKLMKTHKDLNNILTKKFVEIRSFLIFGIVLTLLYFLTSFQRQLLQFIHIVSYSFNDNNINNFKMPPLYNSYLSNSTITYLAMLHYSCGTLRGLLCLGILPKFGYLLRSKIFVCCKTEK